MSWDEVKKLHNRFTKYPLDLLYYITDYKMHGKESYVYNIDKIRDMIYDAVDISMFDDDLIVDTFIHHLTYSNKFGKAIAARYEPQDKNTYIGAEYLHELFHTPLVKNPPVWFKKILMDSHFIMKCFTFGLAHEISYILAKCGIPADHIFKAINRDSDYVVGRTFNSIRSHWDMFASNQWWDGGMFNINSPGLTLKDPLNPTMNQSELTQRIDITYPSIIEIKGVYINTGVNGHSLDIVTPSSRYNIFNLSGINMSNRDMITDILKKKIDSFKYLSYVHNISGFFIPCDIYIIGDTGTSLVGGDGIKLIGRVYRYNF